MMSQPGQRRRSGSQIPLQSLKDRVRIEFAVLKDLQTTIWKENLVLVGDLSMITEKSGAFTEFHGAED